MKLESNKLLGGGGAGGGAGAGAAAGAGGEAPGRGGEGEAEARSSAEQIIDDILAEFSPSPAPAPLLPGGEDIDPASDLGVSIRSKCLELEEILQSLKSRLNSVVLEENIVLSPDANSLEAQLEHDMDTDCQEDLSLQEFLELLQTQTKRGTELQ